MVKNEFSGSLTVHLCAHKSVTIADSALLVPWTVPAPPLALGTPLFEVDGPTSRKWGESLNFALCSGKPPQSQIRILGSKLDFRAKSYVGPQSDFAPKSDSVSKAHFEPRADFGPKLAIKKWF